MTEFTTFKGNGKSDTTWIGLGFLTCGKVPRPKINIRGWGCDVGESRGSMFENNYGKTNSDLCISDELEGHGQWKTPCQLYPDDCMSGKPEEAYTPEEVWR